MSWEHCKGRKQSSCWAKHHLAESWENVLVDVFCGGRNTETQVLLSSRKPVKWIEQWGPCYDTVTTVAPRPTYSACSRRPVSIWPQGRAPPLIVSATPQVSRTPLSVLLTFFCPKYPLSLSLAKALPPYKIIRIRMPWTWICIALTSIPVLWHSQASLLPPFCSIL